jgi:hypothetical protein
MLLLKEIAYKDCLDYTKEERKLNRKYWWKMEREQPLLAHLLYNMNTLLFNFKALIPYVYGNVFKQKQRWNKETQEREWVDVEPCPKCGELNWSEYSHYCHKCSMKRED